MKCGLALVALCLASANASEEWWPKWGGVQSCKNTRKPWSLGQKFVRGTKAECCDDHFGFSAAKFDACMAGGDATAAPATPEPTPVALTTREHDGEVVEASVGTIEDGYDRYEPFLDQSVTVVGKNCRLSWTEFRLQLTWGAMACTTFDYVQVKVGSEVVDTLCSVTKPAPLQLESSNFTLVFHSDVHVQNAGFAVDFTCGHEITPEPTPAPPVNEWYPAWGARSCRNGGAPSWEKKIYVTKEECCERHFKWNKGCMAGGDATEAPATPEPTAEPATAEPVFDGDEWWANWNAGVCQNGGAPHWEKTEVSKEVCCQKFFTWKYKKCLAEGSPTAAPPTPTPPTPSPPTPSPPTPSPPTPSPPTPSPPTPVPPTPAPTPSPPAVNVALSMIEDNGNTVAAVSGTIGDGFDGDYEANVDASVTVVGTDCKITFTEMDVESSFLGYCRADYVRVMAGPDFKTGRRVCGDDLPKEIQVRGDSFRVDFSTNSINNAGGFEVAFSCAGDPATPEPTAAPAPCADLTKADGSPFHISAGSKFDCGYFGSRTADRCSRFGGDKYAVDGMTAQQACCVCGGGMQ